MTHAEALDGKFLPDLDEEQRKRFTPSELIIYKHAQDYRYIGLYTSIFQYILVYNSIYCDILFGRGKSRLGGLSVETTVTEERMQAHRHESRARGVETRRRRKEEHK